MLETVQVDVQRWLLAVVVVLAVDKHPQRTGSDV